MRPTISRSARGSPCSPARRSTRGISGSPCLGEGTRREPHRAFRDRPAAARDNPPASVQYPFGRSCATIEGFRRAGCNPASSPCRLPVAPTRQRTNHPWHSWHRHHWPASSGRSSRAARRRSLRPPTPRAVRRAARRGRLRRAGRPPRPDGPARLPTAPGRPAPCRGRLPGRLPRPRPQGPLPPRPRPARHLALRRRDPHRPQGQGDLARRRQHEQRDTTDTEPDDDARADRPAAPPADQAVLDREQAEVLHAEIDRLPDAFRSPVVLCYFEGLTLDEAAGASDAPPARSAAGWPGAGEAPPRLDPPRRRALDDRDGRRPGPRSASASVPPHLCDITARAAIRFAARQAIASTTAPWPRRSSAP